MTPGARISAAIEVLDNILAGAPAEQALTRWARQSRFAGSKDRAAIRDHVFDALRIKRSAAYYGGAMTGRGLMLGVLRQQGENPDDFFNGQGHAPSALSDQEEVIPDKSADEKTLWNLPDWLVDEFRHSLGSAAEANALALQERAPITLRANLARTTREAAARQLADIGIKTRANALAESALTITEGARKLRQSQPYLEGLVELQDASSQHITGLLPDGGKVLDYCAGGGGKALALAAGPGRRVFAHDADQNRMKDLSVRAARAQANITVLDTVSARDHAPFDLVLCDAPCSGSGTWRRTPQAKWALTPQRLEQLSLIQDKILEDAASLVAEDGVVAYATCSLFKVENQERIAAFTAANPEWRVKSTKNLFVTDDGDGFFTAHLMRV